MQPENREKILQAAIEAFADQGYEGAAARAIAKKAGLTTMTMYYAFRDKDDLFKEALDEIIKRSFDPGKFVLLLYEKQKNHAPAGALLAALQRWYSELPQSSARLLIYGYLSNNDRWRAMAHSALENFIIMLAATIAQLSPKKQKQKPDATIASRALVRLLFEMKATSARSPSPQEVKEEAKEVEMLLNYWFRGLSLAT